VYPVEQSVHAVWMDDARLGAEWRR
jgi:hypothetical protein